SCDETSCAVLDGPRKVLSNVVSSSLARHQPYGGVVPEIASRHCLEAIDVVYREAIARAGVPENKLELIAVTQGPGLIGSILVGVSFAKALSFARRVPLVGVNHLEAHLDANFIESEKPAEPYVGLLVSGGHSALVHFEGGRYRLLGETVDDAVGEAYDKVAKLLGLGYPGGPVIDRLAAEGNPAAVPFTKPRIKNRLDFSFSGIKTAVYYYLEKKKSVSEKECRDLCASFQAAVVGWLVEKTMAACEETGSRVIVTGGGVTANSFLRRRLAEEAEKRGMAVFIPPFKYTTDNAAMIARNGMEKFERKAGPRDLSGVFEIVADPNLAIAV
ncbi:MAG: tRNA (adenosine(37)-N6)-threonylcarbamoyltransferase complex transferase subunit TsaD, partial [Candidatus Omnitrophica bacterium]|nr:tRNA (adenosine(37)-N6)-threonylcarbamoyltransferase complex transferase subunit TsaD [Candidatus Omnitrophota bacterium]